MKTFVWLLCVFLILSGCSVLNTQQIDVAQYQQADEMIRAYALNEAGPGSSYADATLKGMSIRSGDGYKLFEGKKVRVGSQDRLKTTLQDFCEYKSGSFSHKGDGIVNKEEETFTCLVSGAVLFQAKATLQYSQPVSGNVFYTHWHRIDLVNIQSPTANGYAVARELGYQGPETKQEKQHRLHLEAQISAGNERVMEELRLQKIDSQKRKPGTKLCNVVEESSASADIQIVGNTERAEGANIQVRIASIIPTPTKPLIVDDTQIEVGQLVWKEISFWDLCE